MSGTDSGSKTADYSADSLDRVAMAICQSGIGQPDGRCVCARDGREPSFNVARCSECLNAAKAAIEEWCR
jgi:hypothetical protein